MKEIGTIANVEMEIVMTEVTQSGESVEIRICYLTWDAVDS